MCLFNLIYVCFPLLLLVIYLLVVFCGCEAIVESLVPKVKSPRKAPSDIDGEL